MWNGIAPVASLQLRSSPDCDHAIPLQFTNSKSHKQWLYSFGQQAYTSCQQPYVALTQAGCICTCGVGLGAAQHSYIVSWYAGKHMMYMTSCRLG